MKLNLFFVKRQGGCCLRSRYWCGQRHRSAGYHQHFWVVVHRALLLEFQNLNFWDFVELFWIRLESNVIISLKMMKSEIWVWNQIWLDCNNRNLSWYLFVFLFVWVVGICCRKVAGKLLVVSARRDLEVGCLVLSWLLKV